MYSLILAAAWCLATPQRQIRCSIPDWRIELPLSLTRRRFDRSDSIFNHSLRKKERKIHYTSIQIDREDSPLKFTETNHVFTIILVLGSLVPEAAFLTLLVMSFIPLIKIPFPPCIVMSILALISTPFLPFLVMSIPASLRTLVPFPAFFEILSPALFVAISLTSLKRLSLTLHSLLLSLRFYSLLYS